MHAYTHNEIYVLHYPCLHECPGPIRQQPIFIIRCLCELLAYSEWWPHTQTRVCMCVCVYQMNFLFFTSLYVVTPFSATLSHTCLLKCRKPLFARDESSSLPPRKVDVVRRVGASLHFLFLGRVAASSWQLPRFNDKGGNADGWWHWWCWSLPSRSSGSELSNEAIDPLREPLPSLLLLTDGDEALTSSSVSSGGEQSACSGAPIVADEMTFCKGGKLNPKGGDAVGWCNMVVVFVGITMGLRASDGGGVVSKIALSSRRSRVVVRGSNSEGSLVAAAVGEWLLYNGGDGNGGVGGETLSLEGCWW